MNKLIKSFKDIKNIKLVSNIINDIFLYISNYVKSGISTGEINDICHERIIKFHNAYPATLKYMDFPKSICTSINDVVCHGIPKYDDILRSGDVINIDIAICKNNYYSDASRMFFIGKPNKLTYKLCCVAKKSIYLALNYVKDGNKLNLIGKTIQNYVNKNGFSVVKNYGGHGIGKNFHEEPFVLHHTNDSNFILRSGMIFTIEPMINIGAPDTKLMNDGWTVKTVDGSISAQYEHTILVTKDGYEILV